MKEGQHVSYNENPEIISFLEELKLVEVYNKKVLLTHNGGLAAGMGVEDYLKYNKIEKDILDFSLEKNRIKNRMLLLAFCLLFLLFIIALASNLSFLQVL
ncbi:hypothetical protein [Salinimicrobium oceani]|uniref:hypothetical protein n=1 Tax=Salinimicrobium oceani TaxID=2722702 RepID=UPI00143A5C36|nr:hypothetical protein [Salinimicrobium oceani]